MNKEIFMKIVQGSLVHIPCNFYSKLRSQIVCFFDSRFLSRYKQSFYISGCLNGTIIPPRNCINPNEKSKKYKSSLLTKALTTRKYFDRYWAPKLNWVLKTALIDWKSVWFQKSSFSAKLPTQQQHCCPTSRKK